MEYQCRGCRNTDCNLHWKDPDSRWMNCTNFIAPPQTNYDRIVSKTPEELADWITNIDPDNPCPPDNSCWCTKNNCFDGWLSWLKSPVEVQDGD